MTHRIPLSLSPTGAHATRPVRVSPELIDFHAARAHAMRGALFACWAKRAFEALTLRRRPVPDPGERLNAGASASPAAPAAACARFWSVP